MRHIHMIVSREKTYANIQTFDYPWMMQYDLNNKSQWDSFSNEKEDQSVTRERSDLVQPIDISYADKRLQCQEIEARI